jgi:hypothetical protein
MEEEFCVYIDRFIVGKEKEIAIFECEDGTRIALSMKEIKYHHENGEKIMKVFEETSGSLEVNTRDKSALFFMKNINIIVDIVYDHIDVFDE